jgi:hypothetical protein
LTALVSAILSRTLRCLNLINFTILEINMIKDPKFII